jgi:hypothetical protein
MNKEFVPYEQALELKELGFDEPCFGWWFADEETLIIEKSNKSTSENIIQAPTYSQAFRWFREKYGIFVSIVPNRHGSLDSFIGWIYVPLNGSTKDINVGDYKIGFNTPEEAELACLIKLIQIVKQK